MRPRPTREGPPVDNSCVVRDRAGNHTSLHPHDVMMGLQNPARVDDAGLPDDKEGFVRETAAEGLLVGACHVIHVRTKVDIRRRRQPWVGPRDRPVEREMHHEGARTEAVTLCTLSEALRYSMSREQVTHQHGQYDG